MANEVNITMTAKDLASGKIKGVGDQAKTSMDKLRGMRGSFLAVGAAGGAVVGALGLAIKSFAQTGDEIQKMSFRTAIGTEVLSEYKFALEQSGSSIDGFEKAIKRMSSFVLDGRDGLTTTTDALDRLGISVLDLEGLSPEQAFVLLSAALANVNDDLNQAALAQDIFGRAGTTLLPLLAQGADGIEALREEARELGIVFDQDMADSAARVIDAQNTMRKSTLGLQMAFAEHLAPALSATLETMGKVISAVSRFAKENPVLTQALGAMAITVGTLALGIAGLGIAIPIAATMMAGLGVATAGTALSFIGLNVATGGLVIAIGAIVTAIVLLLLNWKEVVRAIKVGINFMIGAFETWANGVVIMVNKVIDGINKLGGVFGKEIDQITEVKIDRLNTAVEEAAEVVDESSNSMGVALDDLQMDFSDTADVAVDAYEKMTISASDWNKKKIAGFIEASKSESDMFQRKRERDAKIAAWDEEQAAIKKELQEQEVKDEEEKQAKLIELEAKAASEKEKIRRQEYDFGIMMLERQLAEEMKLAAIALETQNALDEKNKVAFDLLFQQVMNLPSVIAPKGAVMGIGADVSDFGTRTAVDMLKSKGAGATALGGGMFRTTSITGKPVDFTMNVYGNMFADDTEEMVADAVAQGIQRGAYIESGAGIK
tara:strand:+ start:915 stop:2894 length:1980 start_codon:yes stop_codon:yes gene_type:complete